MGVDDIASGAKDGLHQSTRKVPHQPGQVQEARAQHTANLNDSIHQLQAEIEDLEAKRQTIIRCTRTTTHSVWVVATEYSRHFHRGYMPLMYAPGFAVVNVDAENAPARAARFPQEDDGSEFDGRKHLRS
ncbi:hypothetical protein PHYPSEUDO_003594 [Phytophthora pseudosyringae]|uniref:Uncharacterized protein n=1 Tax=Phytophthora pseudosyringae TaxID=221518 RepID=A0A8T1VQU3_9STRA|nr:hypothetical protein PHYPSEUDO_003594 [Phytophthora pseudosyringae]